MGAVYFIFFFFVEESCFDKFLNLCLIMRLLTPPIPKAGRMRPILPFSALWYVLATLATLSFTDAVGLL